MVRAGQSGSAVARSDNSLAACAWRVRTDHLPRWHKRCVATLKIQTHIRCSWGCLTPNVIHSEPVCSILCNLSWERCSCTLMWVGRALSNAEKALLLQLASLCDCALGEIFSESLLIALENPTRWKLCREYLELPLHGKIVKNHWLWVCLMPLGQVAICGCPASESELWHMIRIGY